MLPPSMPAGQAATPDGGATSPERLPATEGIELGLPEGAFDGAARLASRAVGAPVGFVSVELVGRQVVVGHHGLPEPWAGRRALPLSHALCRHVVMADHAVVIPDVRTDARLRNDPALDDLGIVAYLAWPLHGSGERVVGSFCVIDVRPRRWSAVALEVLADAARGVERELDLRATVRDLDDARRERDHLVQVLAHDIRSPLSTVMAGAEILRRDDLAREDRCRVSSAITRQTQRLTAMAARLLGDDGANEGFATGEPLDQVVAQVVTDRAVTGHGHRLVTSIGEDTDVVVAAEPAASIVTNLLDNALHHTRGQVRLGLTRRGDELVLVVDDDGPGYDLQAVADGRQRPRGFGLGRAIVGHHVAALGGRHDIHSVPDGGTTVTVTLPVPG